MNTLSAINLLPSNNDEVKRFVVKARNEILAGNEDPLKVLIQLKMVEKTIDILLKDKDIDRHFVVEAEKYGKSFEYLNAHFDIRETGVKYAYETCQDSIWNRLNDQKIELEKQLKERESLLKAIPEEGIVNPETGEMIYKPAKSSLTKVVVKL
jgi:hypothetical protein